MWTFLPGEAEDVLKTLDDNQFDSVVTDPPYALDFMGKEWDRFTPGQFQHWCEQWATECYRVLKPGGYLVAFGGTRTYHRLAAGIEDAGFEIRDSLHWIYGSGFPKSRDISKAIDSEAGAEREVTGVKASNRPNVIGRSPGGSMDGGNYTERLETAPSTEAAKQWEGWGTALKPAHEPIVLARKPLANNTVAANVLEHGTGAVNIDACRISTGENLVGPLIQRDDNEVFGKGLGAGTQNNPEGRWPPNILLTHSPYCTSPRLGRSEDARSWDCAEGCPVAEMDRQSGIRTNPGTYTRSTVVENHIYGASNERSVQHGFGDTGGASRFFPVFEFDDFANEVNFKYNAKAPKKERPVVEGVSAHPTVKPVAVMQWLAKLVTQSGGKVLDPFAGTGTTAEACELEGFTCTLIEREPDYVKLINKRMGKYGVNACTPS